MGGLLSGRQLAVPRGLGTRPTSERAREGLFNTLATLTELTGAAVLELYAGSGAVGLEALSRGAARLTLVESDPRTAATARANADALGLHAARVVTMPVDRLLARPGGERYDVVFADPPYRMADDEVDRVLGLLGEGWLAPGAVVVVERSTRGREPRWPDGVAPVKARRYGDATLWYGRRS